MWSDVFHPSTYHGSWMVPGSHRDARELIHTTAVLAQDNKFVWCVPVSGILVVPHSPVLQQRTKKRFRLYDIPGARYQVPIHRKKGEVADMYEIVRNIMWMATINTYEREINRNTWVEYIGK